MATAPTMAHVEQRTLLLSLVSVLAIAMGSLAWGVAAEHDVASHTTHVAKVGRSSFIEVNIVAEPRRALQTVAQQDDLRTRIWQSLELAPDRAWLSVIVTADPRWA